MFTLEQLQAGIVIPVDKPRQWTSFQAVNKIKAVVKNIVRSEKLGVSSSTSTPHSSLPTPNYKIKVGHAGTLDPLATGLLLVCVGKATKSIPQLQDGDKVYTGTIVFGATTPCYDLERPVDRYYPYEHITRELVEETSRRFTGTILQVPPMFSAVKVAGQRAYEYARTDDPSVTIQPKPVTVYSFEITDFREGVQGSATERKVVQDDSFGQQYCPGTPQHSLALPSTTHLYKHPLGEVPPHLPQADFRIKCGKGTYIRSLARDLGEALGSGAFLSSLRREQIGTYNVADAISPDQAEGLFSLVNK